METQQKESKTGLEPARQTREIGFAVDIFENDAEILLRGDLPGVASNEIDIQLDLPEFRIEARGESAGRQVTYRRAFRVDERIDPQSVKAEYRDGVLDVHLAKSAAFRPRRIEVKSS